MKHTWHESGYQAFADGTFGNGGQNLYVSRAGVLQRILHFDFDKNGYCDLLFVNSQDFCERPPIDVYRDPLSSPHKTELPTQGAYAAAATDLTGDGYQDLVIAHQNNGSHGDLMAYIYYGSPDGLTERYKLELHAPNCRSVAIGDFNGNGRPDIAFGCDGRLRIYYQEPEGFRPDRYTNLDLNVTHMTAADLDGDGCAELYLRIQDQPPCILWGGPDGIDLSRSTPVGGPDVHTSARRGSSGVWMLFTTGWTPKILNIAGGNHLFRVEGDQVDFYTADRNRQLTKTFSLTCPHALAAAAGDINGNGHDDLAIITCADPDQPTDSYIYWHSPDGFSNNRKTPFTTQSARDVTLGDLTGNGCADIAVAQGGNSILFTTESLVYPATPDGIAREPHRFTTHDATTVLIARTSDRPHPDLIFINHVTGRVRGDISPYLYHNGPEGFSPERRTELPGWSAPTAVAADFNDNGWADLLIGNCAENAVHIDPGSFLYWGGPDGFHPDNKQIIPSHRTHGCAIGDFRHTGYLDLCVGGFGNIELLIFRNGPDGFDLDNPQRLYIDSTVENYDAADYSVETSTLNPELCEVRKLLAADFNNNGYLDIFVPLILGPRSFILWGGPDGFSMDRTTWLNVDGAVTAQAADLTGNGHLDLIIGGHNNQRTKKHEWESYLYIYYGGPDGFRENRRAQLPAHTCNSIAVADFNHNGCLDILATSYHSGRTRDQDSFIYWGAPDGSYSVTRRKRLYTHSACGCMAADFNHNGWIDIAIASHKTHGSHSGHSQIWWNSPAGFNEERKTLLPTHGPHGMLDVNPGNIADRGPEEYYISNAQQLPPHAVVTTIDIEAECPPRTWVKAQIRSAPTREALSQAPWQAPQGPDTWFENTAAETPVKLNGPHLQYRLALGATNAAATPRVTAVTIHYQSP